MVEMKTLSFIPFVLGILMVAAGCSSESAEGELKGIVTLLPRDGIPAIFNTEHVSISETVGRMNDSDRVLGVSINGESRAYPINALSSHEIANDFVGGVKIAVTW